MFFNNLRYQLDSNIKWNCSLHCSLCVGNQSVHLSVRQEETAVCVLLLLYQYFISDKIDFGDSLPRGRVAISLIPKVIVFLSPAIHRQQSEPGVLHPVVLHLPREPRWQDMDHKGGRFLPYCPAASLLLDWLLHQPTLPQGIRAKHQQLLTGQARLACRNSEVLAVLCCFFLRPETGSWLHLTTASELRHTTLVCHDTNETSQLWQAFWRNNSDPVLESVFLFCDVINSSIQ